MKALKMVIAVGVAVALSGGLTACMPSIPKYTGEAVVKDKEIDRSTSGTGKSRKSSTAYEITVDIPNSDMDRIISVPKAQYETIKVGQTVTVENNKIK